MLKVLGGMKTSKRMDVSSIAIFIQCRVLEDEAEEVFETNWELEVNKFDDMGLKE